MENHISFGRALSYSEKDMIFHFQKNLTYPFFLAFASPSPQK
jgi:hypothetical protein